MKEKNIPSTDKIKKISISKASSLMGKSEQFVRIGLQRQILPFGNAIQGKGGRWSYYISPKLFEEYTGIKI